jgi:hypothetical protein
MDVSQRDILICGPWGNWSDIYPSFLHWMAWFSQRQYVIHEVSKNLGLLKGGKLNLLLTAIAGSNFDLALTLLRMGASPNDQVDTDIGVSDKPVRATIWELVVLMIATAAVCDASEHNKFIRDANGLCTVLEPMLQSGTCVQGVLFLSNGETNWPTPTHYITIEKLIEELQPPNTDSLSQLLKQCTRSALVGMTELANLTLGTQMESVQSLSLEEYIPSYMGKLDSGRVRVISFRSLTLNTYSGLEFQVL